MTLAIEALPRGSAIATPNRRRAGAGEKQINRTQRGWCPVLRVPPAAATGAPGEQKHLPDVITPRQQKETLYDDFNES
jgi:hypothetical protein